MTEHLCEKCGNVLKLVTPIVACCPHCDSVRSVKISDPRAPIPRVPVPPPASPGIPGD